MTPTQPSTWNRINTIITFLASAITIISIFISQPIVFVISFVIAVVTWLWLLPQIAKSNPLLARVGGLLVIAITFLGGFSSSQFLSLPLFYENPSNLSPSQLASRTATAVANTGQQLASVPQSLALPTIIPGRITLTNMHVLSRSFVASARFYNPNDVSEGCWSYGFFFRDRDNGSYRLIIESKLSWELWAFQGDNSFPISHGDIRNLNVSKDGYNKITLVAIDKSAYLFINDVYIDTLDISLRNTAGDIFPAGGFSGCDKTGVPIRIEDFKIRSLDTQ